MLINTRATTKTAAAAIALALTFATPTTASAQSAGERERARTLMDEADKLVEEHRFDQALTSFQAAHAIMHVPTTGMEVARVLQTMGRLIEAREMALEVVRMPGAGSEQKIFADARKEASDLADRLNTRIPTLRFELPPGVDPEGVHVWIDGDEISTRALPLPRRVNPGKHAVRADVKGQKPFARDLDLKDGAREIVVIDFAAPLSSSSSSSTAAAEPSSSTLASSTPRSTRFEHASENEILGLPKLAFYGLAAGAAGFAIGTVTGFLSLNRAAEAERRCGPDRKACEPAAEEYIDSAKTFGWISTLSFTVALAGGGLAIYEMVIKPSQAAKASTSSVGIRVSGSNVIVGGSF